MHELVPFAPETEKLFRVQAELIEQPGELLVHFQVLGPIDQLVLPIAVEHPQFRDELWMTTCLEVFLQEKGKTAYEEWNLSPSGNWANYSFVDYRQRAIEEAKQPLRALQMTRGDQKFILQTTLPYRLKTDFTFGLTAVLHLRSGSKQYWALSHVTDKPDFHQAASFQDMGRGTSKHQA